MPQYHYKARDKTGELITGVLEARDEKKVVDDLDRLGYSVVEISPVQRGGFSFLSLFERFHRLEKREVIIFTRQLATLLKAGTVLSSGLTTVCEQTVNKRFKAILEDISQSVQSGRSFSESLSKHPKVFSELFVSMVEVGETGGMLDKVLDRLATLGTQELEMQSRIKSALIYPVVLVVIALIVVNFLVVGVLPKFVMVFRASEAKLPVITQVILGLSWTLRRFWPVLIGAVILIFLGVQRYARTDEGRFRIHSLMLKVPLFGTLYSKIQISRFARVTSVLVASGIPILQALVVVEKTVTNVVMRRAIQSVRYAITEGHPLAEPFKASGLFSPMVVQMISTGERSGNLDQMLAEISSFYEPEIDYTIRNLTALLEPFMLLVMGVMVSVIALSVLLPIFNLIKVFRG
ncbi:MAG: type II secretion system F family protein [Candidatus Omnitrophota bacterium]|nr:MAG: type II secretion system F family protein [Candidatus Omnitrophota bacterium]